MKRYQITYFTKESQYPKNKWLVGDEEMKKFVVEIIEEKNGFIQTLQSKPAEDNIRRFMNDEDLASLLKELNLFVKHWENLKKVNEAWGD